MLPRLLALLATGEAAIVKRRLKTALIAYAMLGLSVIFAVVFLLLAAYLAAASRWGVIAAAFWFGIAFVVLSIAVYAGYSVAVQSQRREQQRKRAADTTMLAGASAMAMLPTLFGRRSGTIGLLLTVAGLAGYAAYRQYERHRDGRGR